MQCTNFSNSSKDWRRKLVKCCRLDRCPHDTQKWSSGMDRCITADPFIVSGVGLSAPHSSSRSDFYCRAVMSQIECVVATPSPKGFSD